MIKARNTLKVKFNDHTHWLHTSVCRGTMRKYHGNIIQVKYMEKSVAMTHLPPQHQAAGALNDDTNAKTRQTQTAETQTHRGAEYICASFTLWKWINNHNKQSFQLSEELNTQTSTGAEARSSSDGGNLLKSNSEEATATPGAAKAAPPRQAASSSSSSSLTHAMFRKLSEITLKWEHHLACTQQLSIFKRSRLCLHLSQPEPGFTGGREILIQDNWQNTNMTGQQPARTGASHNHTLACKEWRIVHSLNTRY